MGKVRGAEIPEGESLEHLMLAQLVAGYQEAVVCDDEASRLLVEGIERWVGGSPPHAAFAFDRVCAAVGVEARLVRRRLLAVRAAAARDAFWRRRSTG